MHARAFFTINHPMNKALTHVAAVTHELLGLPYAREREEEEVLGVYRAPIEASLIGALGLKAQPQTHWVVRGQDYPLQEFLAVHLAWYRDHPEIVRAGLWQNEERMVRLGLRLRL
jgi:hypothetical protein